MELPRANTRSTVALRKRFRCRNVAMAWSSDPPRYLANISQVRPKVFPGIGAGVPHVAGFRARISDKLSIDSTRTWPAVAPALRAFVCGEDKKQSKRRSKRLILSSGCAKLLSGGADCGGKMTRGDLPSPSRTRVS